MTDDFKGFLVSLTLLLGGCMFLMIALAVWDWMKKIGVVDALYWFAGL